MLRLPKMGCRSWQIAAQRTRSCRNPREARRSLALLRAAVGSVWPGWRNQHPLARQFFTSLQGADPEGVERLLHAHACLPTSGPKAVRAGLRRLGGESWSAYEGAALEFRLTAACLKEGFAARLLDERGGGDLAVTFVDRALKVECKVLQPRTESDAFGEFMQAVVDVCFSKLDALGRTELRFPGWMSTVVEHTGEVLSCLDAIAETPRAVQRNWPGISLHFEPGAAALNTPFIEGPGIRRSGHQGDDLELVKLRQCIRSHESQLEGVEPALFAVKVRDLLDTSVEPQVIEEHILRTVRELPHVGGVLCMQEDLLPGTLSRPAKNEAETLWVMTGPSPVGLRRAVVFVRNDAASHQISQPEILGWFRCFMRS